MTLTWGLAEDILFHMTLLIIKENNGANLFWNPCTNVEVMAQTISVYDSFNIWPSSLTVTFSLPEKCVKWHSSFHRSDPVYQRFQWCNYEIFLCDSLFDGKNYCKKESAIFILFSCSIVTVTDLCYLCPKIIKIMFFQLQWQRNTLHFFTDTNACTSNIGLTKEWLIVNWRDTKEIKGVLSYLQFYWWRISGMISSLIYLFCRFKICHYFCFTESSSHLSSLCTCNKGIGYCEYNCGHDKA